MPRPDRRCRCTEIRRPHYYGDHYTPPAEPPQEDGPAVSAEQGTTRLGKPSWIPKMGTGRSAMPSGAYEKGDES